MAGSTVDTTLTTEFSDMLHVKAQQIQSRLRPFIDPSLIRQLMGDDFAYDGLGDVEAREIVGRIQKTVFDDIEHLRRKLKRRRFVVTLPIDASDVRGQLLNQNGAYASACIRAMARVWDRVGVEAAFADVQTGRNFGTTVTFAGDGGLTVNATAGTTYEKLLELVENWIDNEVGNDMPESLVLAMTGKEHTAFMGETELTSGDFSRQFAIDAGRIREGVGVKFLLYGGDVTNPILSVSGGTRDCLAMTGRGLCYGISKDASIKIADRDDYVETTQVQIITEIGAVRTEGVQVQKFQTTA